jgi:tetratricopeptide (TPR) repeat protein
MLKIKCIIGLLFCHSILFGQQLTEMNPLEKDKGKLLEQIENLLLSNPSASLYFQKGQILKERFDYPGSLSAIRKALEYDSINTVYLSELADIHIALGNNPDAVSIFQKVLMLTPSDATIKGKYGRLLAGMQDYKNAYQVFTELKGTDSTNLFFNKQLALCSAFLGKNREAKVLFKNVLIHNPRDYGSYLSLSNLFQQDTAYKEAVQVLQKGLEQFPGNGVLLLKKAQIFYLSGKYERAADDYEAYLQSNDTLVNIRKEYGVCLYLSKKEEKALKILEPALYLVPNDPIVAMYVGLCYKNLKDFENANDYLQLAAKLAIPGYQSGIYQSLGQVHGMRRQFPQAIAMYKKAYELDETNHELLFEMATTTEEYIADKSVAYQYYRQYMKKAGDNALNAGYATSRMNKIKEKLFFGE